MTSEVRSFHHSEFALERLRDERAGTVSVCVPARECAATIGHVVSELVALREAGAIDQVLVVDAASADGTAGLARAAGAEVHQEAELVPEAGPVSGKGDAMWRALSVLRGDVVCFVDGDTEGFRRHFALGLAGAVACGDGVSFVKAFFRRPFRAGDVVIPEGGGRVNELLARPLLRAFWPALAGIRQPLAGEAAARRELLERLPFVTGYGVEMAMLLDAAREAGVPAVAQVDLEERQNRHQPLPALAPMADAVLAAALSRLAREGRPVGGDPPEVVERPPMASMRAAS
ncbi:MAG: glucosyl-3-phosphoglycerate synthase [Solirubrobacteraceae bacterium]|nr:glucosyl-3-phosphoglycerate synthase [Solirubrobacteraceae bacterium]